MKSKIIKNDYSPARPVIISENFDNKSITQFGENKELKCNTLNELNEAHRTNNYFHKNCFNENSFENMFLKNILENLFDYFSDQCSKENTLNKFDYSQLMLTEKEKMPAIDHFVNVNQKPQNKSLFENKNEEKIIKLKNEKLNKGSSNKALDKSVNSKSNKADLIANKKPGNFSNNNIFKTDTNINIKEFIIKKEDSTVNLIQSNRKRHYSINNLESTENIINKKNNVYKGKQISEPNPNLNNPHDYSNKKIHQGVNHDLVNSFSQNNCSNIGIFEQNSINEANTVASLFNNNNLGNELNLYKTSSINSNLGTHEFKKESLIHGLHEDEKTVFLKSYMSPNLFEDYSFCQNSHIFNSPNPLESIVNKIPEELNEDLNINFNLSRHSTIDYNDIFKTGTPDNFEEKKLPKENNIFYDDSFFSISSNEKISEGLSQPTPKTNEGELTKANTISKSDL